MHAKVKQIDEARKDNRQYTESEGEARRQLQDLMDNFREESTRLERNWQNRRLANGNLSRNVNVWVFDGVFTRSGRRWRSSLMIFFFSIWLQLRRRKSSGKRDAGIRNGRFCRRQPNFQNIEPVYGLDWNIFWLTPKSVLLRIHSIHHETAYNIFVRLVVIALRRIKKAARLNKFFVYLSDLNIYIGRWRNMNKIKGCIIHRFWNSNGFCLIHI